MDFPATQSSATRSRLLLVDPDESSRDLARRHLVLPEIEVVEAAGMKDALAIAEQGPLALVVTELSLADGSGLALCRSIRESASLGSTPIVIVSHWYAEADRILAFECGVDDFVAKPYFGRELVSRVRAVLRRSARFANEPGHDRGSELAGLSVDASRRAVWVEGSLVPLTQREFDLLETLARSGGHVLSRTDLIRDAWSDSKEMSERSVDAQVKSLRRKLGSAGDAIQTVRGLGYRLMSARRSGDSSAARGASEPPLRRPASRRRGPMR